MRNMMMDQDYEDNDSREECLCCGNDVNVYGYWHDEYSRFECPCSFAWEYPTQHDYEMGWAYYTDHMCMCKYEYEDE